jgi:hypothetical protein
MGWKLSKCERAPQEDPETPGALPSLVILANQKQDLLNALGVPIYGRGGLRLLPVFTPQTCS